MALNLQTLTSPTTSSDVIADIENPADSSDLVVTLKNLATESGKTTNATQTVSAAQGTSIQDKGLYLPGTTENEAVVPSSADIDPTGDLDLRVEYEHADGFTRGGLIGKQYTSNYYLRPETNGDLFFWRNLAMVGSTALLPNTDRRWVRVTHRVSDDRVQFFTSSDGEVWEQLGDDVTIAANTPFQTNTPLRIGSLTNNSQNLHGIVYKAQVYASIDGTDKRLDIDFTSNNITAGATSFTADSGQVVTINQSGDDFAHISKGSHLIMDLVDDEYEFTTDAAIDGTIVVATIEGTYSAGISLAASTQYDLQARGVASTPNYGFLKNPVGYLVSSSPLSESEITQMENYFIDKGAAARSAFGSVTDFTRAWFDCSTLSSFPLIDTSSATNLGAAWQNCTSLTSFPAIDTSSGTNFNQTWRSCSSLTSFPLIDTSSGTNFGSTWQSCSSLTSFPLIDTSSGTNFNSTWRGCNSLTTFPLIDTSSGENITAAWQSCTSLSSFPLIDASAATTVNRTWSTCSSLTSFPAIDIPLSTDFFQTWSTCSSLTSFPLIDVSSGQRFSFAWQKCTNLTTFPAGFFDNWSPTSLFNSVFSETWGLCTSLTAQSVENILTSIDTSGVYGTNTGLVGGTQLADHTIDIGYDTATGSLSTATNSAIASLIGKDWEVTINGEIITGAGPLYLGSPLVAGNFMDGTAARSEISGGSAARLPANEDFFFLCHDSSASIFISDRFGSAYGSLSLDGVTVTDAEALVVTNEPTPRIIVGAFGDNAASRVTKQLFFIDEPVVTGGVEIIPNDGTITQVDFVYPDTPLWSGGNNRGDAEAMFVADDTIYIISKREPIPKLFSLPLQASYVGTQTLTYEGEVYDVPDVVGVTAGNIVDATISSDELHIVAKTYGQSWRWSRENSSTSIPTLLVTAPTEMPYVGLGSHPAAEPQGETVMFNSDDSAVYYLSENGTGSIAHNFPFFVSYVSQLPTVLEVTYQDGVSGYSSAADTTVWDGPNAGVNYGSASTFTADLNASDTRYGLLRFSDLEATFPVNGVLVGSALDLFITSEGISFDVYVLTNPAKAWVEGTVTWTSMGGITLGTDTPADPCARVYATDTRAGDIQIAIDPAIVQGWLDTPSSNLGFVLVGTNQDGVAFASKENGTTSQNPQLRLQYNPDPDAPIPVVVTVRHGVDGYASGEDAYWWQDGSGSGTDYSAATTVISDKNPSDERFGYHKWGDLNTVIPSGATITSVEMDLYINTEGQGFDFFELLSTFDPTDSYDDLVVAGKSLARNDVDVSSTLAVAWPGVDTYVGPITLASTAELVSLVQGWVDTPASNHGLLCVATHATDGQQVVSNEAVESQRPLLRITYTE